MHAHIHTHLHRMFQTSTVTDNSYSNGQSVELCFGKFLLLYMALFGTTHGLRLQDLFIYLHLILCNLNLLAPPPSPPKAVYIKGNYTKGLYKKVIQKAVYMEVHIELFSLHTPFPRYATMPYLSNWLNLKESTV